MLTFPKTNRKKFLITVAAAALFGSCLTGGAVRADGIVPGYILVAIDENAGIGDVVKTLNGGDDDYDDDNSWILEEIPNTKTYALRVPVGETESGFAGRANTTRGVRYAETDTYFGDPKSLPFGFRQATVEPSRTQDYIAQSSSVETIFQAGLATSEYRWQPAYNQVRLAGADAYSTGEGIKIAVLDTGVQPLSAPLYGRCTQGYNALDKNLPADDVLDGVSNSATGHGTAVAGIIARIAPNADIVPVRVLNGDGRGTGLSVVKGIYYAVGEGADVVNMSFGSSTPSLTLSEAVSVAVRRGVLPVASAGNDGDERHQWPAACPGVLAVASLDANDLRSDFSNYGVNVGVCAPGRDINAPFHDGGYASWSGTSFAAPFVAGQAALIFARYQERNGAAVASRIRGTARHLPNEPLFGARQLGSGLIDIAASVK